MSIFVIENVITMPEDIVHNIGSIICNEFENKEIQKHFSKQEWDILRCEKEDMFFEKGDFIFREGSTPRGVYCVKLGKAKLYKNGFNGKEQILRFVKEGDLIGYRSLLCNEFFGASAMALEKMNICFIPEKFFNKLLTISPNLAFDMLKRISHELGEAAKTITILAQKTVRERLAEILLLLEKKLGTDPEGYINIIITREEMANLIGTATESAIRLISEFKTDELIEVEGRKIKIINREKIMKLGNIK